MAIECRKKEVLMSGATCRLSLFLLFLLPAGVGIDIAACLLAVPAHDAHARQVTGVIDGVSSGQRGGFSSRSAS